MMKINIDNLKTRKNFLYYILKNGAQIKSNENSTFSMEEKVVLVNCSSKKELVEVPYEGIFEIKYKDISFTLEISKDTTYHIFLLDTYGCTGSGGSTPVTMKLFQLHFSSNIKKEMYMLIEEAMNNPYDGDNSISNGLTVYHNNKDYWSKHSETSYVQTLDQIFLPTTTKNDIVEPIETFISLKEKYEKYGMYYKFTMMLEGKAGMGKSSIARAIAHKYKRKLYILNLGNKQTQDSDIIQLFKDISENSVLVIEDIDSFFIGRKSGEESFSGISFPTLLNLLDGNLSNGNGLITFITANHPEYLDKALIRIGRIDKVIKFTEMTKEQFDEAWKARISETIEPDEELFKICVKNNISMSGLMFAFFFAKTNEERRNMVRQFVSERNFSPDSNHMYC